MAGKPGSCNTQSDIEDLDKTVEVKSDILSRLSADIELKYGQNATALIFAKNGEEIREYLAALQEIHELADIVISLEELSPDPALDSKEQSQVWFHQIFDPMNSLEKTEGVVFYIVPFNRDPVTDEAVQLLYNWLNQSRNEITQEGTNGNTRLTNVIMPETDLDIVRHNPDLFTCCTHIFLN